MTIPKTLGTLQTSEIEVPEISNLIDKVVKLKTIYQPDALNLTSESFSGIQPSAPIKTPSELSFIYTALAETVQAVINGKINEFINYAGAYRINDRRFRIRVPSDSGVTAHTSLKEEIVKYKTELKTLTDEQGSKGFPLPTGEFSDRISEAFMIHKTALIEQNKRLYNGEQEDILAKIEEGIKAANTVEIILFDSHNHIQAVTLEAATKLVDNAYQVYNIEVEKYNQQLRSHSILISNKLDEFRDKILPLDEFSLKVKGKSLDNENAILSNSLYTSAVRYITAQTESVNSNIDLLELEAEEERQKILRYKAEVGKFEALVNQNVANVEAYRARVRAESTKLETYKAEIRTSDALLRSQEAQTKIKSTQGQSQVDIVSANLEVADAELNEARILLDNAVREGRVTQTEYERDLTAYTANLQDWFTDKNDEIFRVRKSLDRNINEEIEDRSNKQALKRDTKRIQTTFQHKSGDGLSLAEIARDHIAQVADVQASTNLVSELLHTVVRGPTS